MVMLILRLPFDFLNGVLGANMIESFQSPKSFNILTTVRSIMVLPFLRKATRFSLPLFLHLPCVFHQFSLLSQPAILHF